MSGFRASARCVFVLVCLLQPAASPAETVAVRYREGVARGFLVLRTPEGKPIADGDSTQATRGGRITSRLRFRFKDGSVYEETTVFSQHGTFRLLRDHVLEKGPAFSHPTETTIDATSGQVTVRYTDDGRQKVLTERLELPPDISNGILFTLLKNVQRGVAKTTVSYLATTPKPRLVHLEIISRGQESFSIGSYSHKAIHYVVKVKLGGVAGLVAALDRKGSPRYPSMGDRGRCPRLRKIRWPFVRRRAYLADGTGYSGRMARQHSRRIFSEVEPSPVKEPEAALSLARLPGCRLRVGRARACPERSRKGGVPRVPPAGDSWTATRIQALDTLPGAG